MHRSGSSITRRVAHGVGGLLALALCVLLTGAGYEYLANRRDLLQNPAPGQLFDVGGHRLHLWCTGEGFPVVVLEAGGGDNALVWSLVQPEVAKTTRVCSYDRAGFGWSELGPNPRSAAQVVKELHTLLEAAHVSGPYVLTGHSLGGLFVRLYSSTYPTDVAGMVLVESTHEGLAQRMPPEAGAPGGNSFLLHLLLDVNELMTVVGYRRLTARPFGSIPGVPVETIKLAEQVRLRTAAAFADAEETLALGETMRQVREARRTMDLPLVVVTKGRYDGLRALPNEAQEFIRQAWQAMQADLVSLSPQGTQVVAANSEHYVPLMQPDVVIDAIRTVVARARLGATPNAR